MNDVERPRPRVGVGVIVRKEGKVLLGKRKGSHGANHWAPPGGHLEFGETVEQCATRELFEESGIQALSMQCGPYTSDIIDGDKHYVTLFVVVDRFEGVPQLMEPHKCEGWEWFVPDALPSPLFVPFRSILPAFQL
jgi:8-oxo-dGTP diphosphatase